MRPEELQRSSDPVGLPTSPISFSCLQCVHAVGHDPNLLIENSNVKVACFSTETAVTNSADFFDGTLFSGPEGGNVHACSYTIAVDVRELSPHSCAGIAEDGNQVGTNAESYERPFGNSYSVQGELDSDCLTC
jgi:hypothetical protein